MFGDSGTIIRISDPSSYLQCKSNTSEKLYSVAYNGKVYVAVGEKSTIIASDDGDNWKIVNVPNKNYDYEGITWDEKQFFISGVQRNPRVDIGTVLSSENGLDWAQIPDDVAANIFGYTELNNIVSNGSIIIATNLTGYYGCMFISRNGDEWSQVEAVENICNDIIWDGNYFIAVGDGSYIARSKDGIKWEIIKYENDISYNFNAVISNGKQYIISGNNGSIFIVHTDK